MATVRLSDVVIPEFYYNYVVADTAEKTELVQSGVIERSSQLDDALAGGSHLFNLPFWNDLKNEEENISSDDPAVNSVPKKITANKEVQVRLARNQSWSAMDLSGQLAGSDPIAATLSHIASYWRRRQQAAFVATMAGLFAQNDTATDATHTQYDLTHDIKGTAFTNGVTTFSAKAFNDAILTIGDAMGDLSAIMVNSVVFTQMKNNDLIKYVPESQINAIASQQYNGGVPTFQGRRVIIDDAVPMRAGVAETWIFGRGAVKMGLWTPPGNKGFEYERKPSGGNGAGEEIVHSRLHMCIHPTGHAWNVASVAGGGPKNDNTAGNLAHADSWKRVFPERKQIKIARLITREF